MNKTLMQKAGALAFTFALMLGVILAAAFPKEVEAQAAGFVSCADAGYSTQNCIKQGGAEWQVGGNFYTGGGNSLKLQPITLVMPQVDKATDQLFIPVRDSGSLFTIQATPSGVGALSQPISLSILVNGVTLTTIQVPSTTGVIASGTIPTASQTIVAGQAIQLRSGGGSTTSGSIVVRIGYGPN